MNATAIIFTAADFGVRLSVTADDRIQYRPKSRMTPELLAEIKANKEALIFDVLMSDALRYIGQRYVEGTDLSSPALDAPHDRLNEAYFEGELEAYHQAIREYVRAALREIERAKREREAA